MGNPILGISSSVGFKEESTPGTKESLASGASFVDLVLEALDYEPKKYTTQPLIGNRQQHANFDLVTHHDVLGCVRDEDNRSPLVCKLPE